MSQLNTWFSGSYNLSSSSSTMLPEWKVKELFCRSTHWDWAPQLCVFFGCFLQWSSSIPKKGSVGERWELNLSVGTMFSIWSVNNDYAGLVELWLYIHFQNPLIWKPSEMSRFLYKKWNHFLYLFKMYGTLLSVISPVHCNTPKLFVFNKLWLNMSLQLSKYLLLFNYILTLIRSSQLLPHCSLHGLWCPPFYFNFYKNQCFRCHLWIRSCGPHLSVSGLI